MGLLDNFGASSETELESSVKTAAIGQEGEGLLATEGAIIASGESLEELNMQTLGWGAAYTETGGVNIGRGAEVVESGASRAEIQALGESTVEYNVLDGGSIEKAFAFALQVHDDYAETVDDVLGVSLELGDVVKGTYEQAYDSARFDKIGTGQWSQYMPLIVLGSGLIGLFVFMRKGK